MPDIIKFLDDFKDEALIPALGVIKETARRYKEGFLHPIETIKLGAEKITEKVIVPATEALSKVDDISEGNIVGDDGRPMLVEDLPLAQQAAGATFHVFKNIGTGVLGTGEAMSRGFEWLGIDSAKPIGDKLQGWQEIAAVQNPTFADNLASGLGSAATFYIPGVGAAKAAGFFARFSPKLAMLFGGTVSTALEALTEAGDIWQETKDNGLGEKEADSRANKVFWANAVLIGVTNRLGIFNTDVGQLKKFLLSAPLEGLQEFGQQVIANVTAERKWDEGAYEAGAIGTILGGLMGTADFGTKLPTPQEIENKKKEVMKETGLNSENAEKLMEFTNDLMIEDNNKQQPDIFNEGVDKAVAEAGGTPAIVDQAIQQAGVNINVSPQKAQVEQPAPTEIFSIPSKNGEVIFTNNARLAQQANPDFATINTSDLNIRTFRSEQEIRDFVLSQEETTLNDAIVKEGKFDAYAIVDATSGNIAYGVVEGEKLADTLRKQQFITTKEAQEEFQSFNFVRELKLPVKFNQRILTPAGKEAFGKYQGAITSFIKNPAKSTPSHEAVHGFLDLMVGANQKQDILNEVKRRYAGKKLDNNAAEEQLANDFIKYIKAKQNNKKAKAASTKLQKLFDWMIENFKKITEGGDKIDQFFEDVITKKPTAQQKIDVSKKLELSLKGMSELGDPSFQTIDEVVPGDEIAEYYKEIDSRKNKEIDGLAEYDESVYDLIKKQDFEFKRLKIEDVLSKEEGLEDYNAADYVDDGFNRNEKTKLNKIDLKNPIIIGNFDNGSYGVIDGYNRLLVNFTNDKKTVFAYVAKEEAKFQTRESVIEEADSIFRSDVKNYMPGFTELVARERFNMPKLKKLNFGGSDRDVYDLGDGNVVKIAKTARGLAQNQLEGEPYAPVPEEVERGLNYVVVKKAEKPNQKTKDLVKLLDKHKEFTSGRSDVDANNMINNAANELYSTGKDEDEDLANTIQDFNNYSIMINDMTALRNWGTIDGEPVLVDAGSLNTNLLDEYKGKRPLDDADFREAYDRSKAAKIEFGDVDPSTKYQDKDVIENEVGEIIKAATGKKATLKQAINAATGYYIPKKMTKTETQLLKQKIRAISSGVKMGRADMKAVLNAAFKTNITALETKLTEKGKITKEKAVRKEQLKSLKEGIKQRVKFEGKVSDLKARAIEINDIKKAIIEFAKPLSKNDKGKLLPTITKAENKRDLVSAYVRIDNLLEMSDKREALEELKKTTKQVDLARRTGKNIALDYQRQIMDIMKSYSIKKPMQKTINKLKDLKTFIEKNPDIQIPAGVTKKLGTLLKTPAKDLSVEGLRELNNTITQLAALGNLKLQLKNKYDERQRQITLEKLTASTRNMDKVKRGFLDTIHSFRVTDIMDGNQDYKGQNTRIQQKISQKVGNAELTSTALLDSVFSQIRGFKEKWTEEDQAIMELHLLIDMNAKTQAQQLISVRGWKEMPKLTDDMQLAMDVMRGAFDKYVDNIAAVFEEENNKEFERVNNYFPLKYEKKKGEIPEPTIGQQIVRTKKTPQGFTFGRQKNIKRVPRVDVFAQFEEAVREQQYYLNVQPTLIEAHSLVNDGSYAEAGGDKAVQWWRDYIDAMANKGRLSRSTHNAWLARKRINLSRAILGYKISSILIQPMAIFDALAYTYGRFGTTATARLLTHFAGAFIDPIYASRVKKLSPALQLRDGGELAIEEIEGGKTREGLNKIGIIDKFQKHSLAPLKWLDQKTAASVAQATYRTLKARGLSETEARKESDLIMNITSGSSEIADRPMVLMSGEVWKSIFTFQTFMLNRWGLISHDLIGQGLKSGTLGRKARTIIGLMILSMGGAFEDEMRTKLFELISGKKYPKDNFIKSALMTIPESVPILGSMLRSIVGYGQSYSIPLTRTIENVFVGMQMATSDKESTRNRGILKMSESLATLFGVAGTAQAFDFIERALQEDKKIKKIEGNLNIMPGIPEINIPSLPNIPTL